MILNVENQRSLHYCIRDHIIIIVLVLFSAKLSVLQGYPFSSHNLCNPATLETVYARDWYTFL